MKHVFSSQSGRTWGLIEAEPAVTMLSDPDTLRYLSPFLGRTLTVTQAGRLAGARTDTMMYRTERFLEAGLLIEVPTDGRRRQYRAAADRFALPFEATRFESLVEVLLRHTDDARQKFARGLVASMAGEQGGWMLRIHRDNGRDLHSVDAAPMGDFDWTMKQMLAPDSPATWLTVQALRLADRQAKELQHELLALWDRYQNLNLPEDTAESHAKFTLQLHLAPLMPG